MTEPLHELLRRARISAGESLPALARRSGVRIDNLRLIETDCFEDLPAGLYGRAAVRNYAAAYGLDPAAALAACESRLRRVDEPIAALARLHGAHASPFAFGTGRLTDRSGVAATTGRVDGAESAAAPSVVDDSEDAAARPSWRPVAAAIIDALAIALPLLAAMLAAVTLLPGGRHALAATGAPFGAFGAVLAAMYFWWFGGIRGETPGQRAAHVPFAPRRSRADAAIDLRRIAVRAALAAAEDVLALLRLGAAAGRHLTAPDSWFAVRSATWRHRT